MSLAETERKYVYHGYYDEPLCVHAARITRYWYSFYRRKALNVLGNKCVLCGFSDDRALQIDHINGNKGRKRLNLITIFKEIVNGKPSDEYQILCANCNAIKKYKNREMPNIKYDKFLVEMKV